jgi:hypothetical protein
MWEGAVLPEPAPFHNVCYTQNHRKNFMDRKRKKIELGNMARSCKKCGFFVGNSNSPTKQIGYCLFFNPKKIEEEESRRKLKIIDGEEKTLASGCKGYINTIDYV